MGFLKSALAQAMDLVPENSLVGMITFGTFVQVHELGFGHVSKSYVFKGTKDVSKDQLLEQMNFFAKKPRPATGIVAGPRDGLSAESIARFLLPVAECEFALNSVSITLIDLLLIVYYFPKLHRIRRLMPRLSHILLMTF